MNVKELIKLFGYWILIILIISWIINKSPSGRDNTDKQGWFSERSGMALLIDNLTGCQYLSTIEGGITQRLNESGQHICNKI